MGDKHHWDKLIYVMMHQKGLLDEFADESSELRNALQSREWTSLEKSMNRLNNITARIEGLEKKRLIIVQRLVGEGSLEKKIAELPPEQRHRYFKIRSELKARLVTVRSKTRGLAGYASSRAKLGKELMEELVPSTRGRMYDNRGRSASNGRDPLVVSRHL